jgi:hypothetical protein
MDAIPGILFHAKRQFQLAGLVGAAARSQKSPANTSPPAGHRGRRDMLIKLGWPVVFELIDWVSC